MTTARHRTAAPHSTAAPHNAAASHSATATHSSRRGHALRSSRCETASPNTALLDWYATNGRELLVRTTADPWRTLVAEVMSHQTQIGRVADAWQAFVARWPAPAALALAPTDELLRAWAGLGYNRRALALREAARRIVAEHGGQVPSDVEALEQLPGVGAYTARAVAATSFGVPVAPLDVNVRRVVARVLGRSAADRALQADADALVFASDPRRWLYAVMDLAATVCTRRRPACDACPIAAWCESAGAVVDETPKRGAEGGRFEDTRRWLRGRIVARLREAAAGSWLDFDEPIGSHAIGEVRAALEGLAADGFVEAEGSRARLV